MGRNNVVFIVLVLIALVLGIAIKLFIGRRRFYRRNQAGLQSFRNYLNALITPFVESVLAFIGILLIISGIRCLAVSMFVGK